MRFVRSLALCWGLALAVHASAALADVAPPTAAQQKEAAALKLRADSEMESLRYAEALADYTRAYDLSPDPVLLYNRGRVLQALERFAEALDQIERFAHEAPPELRARVPKLQELLADLGGRVSALTIRCDVPGARVLVRDKVVATTPASGPIRLNSGPAVVEVDADGYEPFRRSVQLPGGGAVQLDATLTPKEPGPVAAGGSSSAESRPITTRWWFWTGVGVVVVGGAVLTYALLTDKPAGHGDIAPGQVSGPLVRF